MENWLTAPWTTIWKTFFSCLFILLSILVIVRLAGLRTFTKMSSTDFATTIAIGSIIATIILYPDQSLIKGALSIGFLVGLQWVFSVLKRKYKWFRSVATNTPVLLMKEGEILEQNIKKSGVSRMELMAKLRQANVLRLSDVYAVVFETTGDISIMHSQNNVQVDEKLLEGIKQEK